MTEYHNHGNEPHFTFAKEGKKTIEVRLRKGKYTKIKPGDTIVIECRERPSDTVTLSVVSARKYITLHSLFSHEVLSEVMPDAKDVNDAIKQTRKFYTEEQEREFGVVAIEVKVIH